ncbi:hypothetical protein [Microbacterium sp.]|uniref:hypothetical protein n=1 Tax=Microbacterium sp. TaxID=51671 RepID=UPI002897EFFE|nr:hypothetical protein [Microbacterium sp.]
MIGSTAALACVVGLLTGCTSPEPERTVVQNQSMWAMPLDEFKIFNPSLSNYAEQLLIAKCLEGQGYEWPVPWQDTDFPQPETVNDAALKIFNPELARRYGYHDAPPPNPADLLAWTEFTAWTNVYDPDEQFRSRFDACGEEARSDKTVAGADGLNYIASLEMQTRDEISSIDAVRDAAETWKSCLSGFITFELPDDPWGEIPTLEMAQEYGIYGDNLTEVASPEELSIAEADARCRDSSGYTEARYQAEWSAQENLVTENRDKLERIRNDAVAHTDELRTLIAENAPSK